MLELIKPTSELKLCIPTYSNWQRSPDGAESVIPTVASRGPHLQRGQVHQGGGQVQAVCKVSKVRTEDKLRAGPEPDLTVSLHRRTTIYGTTSNSAAKIKTEERKFLQNRKSFFRLRSATSSARRVATTVFQTSKETTVNNYWKTKFNQSERQKIRSRRVCSERTFAGQKIANSGDKKVHILSTRKFEQKQVFLCAYFADLKTRVREHSDLDVSPTEASLLLQGGQLSQGPLQHQDKVHLESAGQVSFSTHQVIYSVYWSHSTESTNQNKVFVCT